MDFIIKETGERERLSLLVEVDKDTGDQIDICEDVIAMAGDQNICYDAEVGAHLISAEGFKWWQEYISDHQADIDELARLREVYGSQVVEAALAECDPTAEDYDKHHERYQELFSRVHELAYEAGEHIMNVFGAELRTAKTSPAPQRHGKTHRDRGERER